MSVSLQTVRTGSMVHGARGVRFLWALPLATA